MNNHEYHKRYLAAMKKLMGGKPEKDERRLHCKVCALKSDDKKDVKSTLHRNVDNVA